VITIFTDDGTRYTAQTARELLKDGIEGTLTCSGCQIVVVNGLACHEHGCPEKWRDQLRTCKQCGCDFYPSEKYQYVCDCDQD